jgi:hypothetical protein
MYRISSWWPPYYIRGQCRYHETLRGVPNEIPSCTQATGAMNLPYHCSHDLSTSEHVVCILNKNKVKLTHTCNFVVVIDNVLNLELQGKSKCITLPMHDLY